jgi:hypothetical protein
MVWGSYTSFIGSANYGTGNPVNFSQVFVAHIVEHGSNVGVFFCTVTAALADGLTIHGPGITTQLDAHGIGDGHTFSHHVMYQVTQIYQIISFGKGG